MTPGEAASYFAIPELSCPPETFRGGHVNDSFLLTAAGGSRFLLQRIGPPAFADPDAVMANIVLVTQHLAGLGDGPQLHLQPTTAGAWSLVDGDHHWRVYDFIEDSTSLEAPAELAELTAVGRLQGAFLKQLSDIAVEDLAVVIPHFHDEPRYMERLKVIIEEDPAGRVTAVQAEITQALSYEELSHCFDDPELLPLRATHNDTKLSNVLVTVADHSPICVVDLDTIQPGLVVSDFGDAIRSGAATTVEDSLVKPRIDLNRFRAYTAGFLAGAAAILTPAEVSHLRQGAAMAALETSLRFLTDHLAGDVYFHVDYPDHNLVRARNQLALLKDILAHWEELGITVDQEWSRLSK
ncbi:MAG: aminoglycoside phosphotransferase family protein [Propionibacteriaceae bacterium]|jgi:Ser/Thr protein kinase RdoA (MazF antagonist)|nr:aminoglycoside phosphotransferase family protein [Propionibacteriaceae bacterium]